ncbi:MAG TPA: DUF2090 domain-containing protein [Gemmatimonadaceae bacterium]
MKPGYDRPLYLLPFDHRHSYESGLFKVKEPLTPAQHAQIADSKRVIYEGFKAAAGSAVPAPRAGILVDEEFGADVLRDGRRNGFVTALPTEKSGSDEFDFQYGADFTNHITSFDPTFAKALVRYNPEGDTAMNRRQTARLRTLSDFCHGNGRRFMFELLVPATAAQLDRVQQDSDRYDREVRPALVVRTIEELQDAGVEPDVWKIEGFDRREACESAVAAARRAGRGGVGCIVLGRGADEQKVVQWLTTAASVPGFIGFAVGRTTFWDAVADYEAKRATRQQAATRIAQRFAEWASIFERAATA